MLVKAVIFDLDNTLYDERQYVRSGFRAVSEYMANKFELDRNHLYRLLLQIFSKKGRGKVFNIALEKINMKNEQTVLELVDVYRNHSPTIALFEDAENTLSKLRQKYRLGLVTDGVKKVQENKIKALNIASLFDTITYAVEYGGKTNNEVFLTTLRKLKTKPSHSVYIDDNPTKAFAITKKLNIKTIRIMKGENKNILAPDEECKPDFEIRNLKEILRIIQYIENI
ncbi:MAG: HAD family hydrolase [Candidatus Hodarchaeota archaeon]